MPGASLPAYRATALPAGASFPLELIEQVISQTGTRERRRRLLPAAAVMVFVLGCCLFYGEGYGEVARKLSGWLGPLAGRRGWRVPGTAALARARRRLGPRPFELLFARLAGPLATPADPGAAAFGLVVMAIDGTMLDLPATPANLAAFGPPPRGPDGGGGCPQARLVVLSGCGTRGLADAMFAPRKGPGTSEQALARAIAGRGRLGRGMLVLADRAFSGYPVISALAATGADVLIRATTSPALPVLQALPDGSWLSVLADPAAARRRHNRNAMRRKRASALPPDTITTQGITIRVIDAAITAHPAGAQPVTTRYRLLTTLTDPAAAPAAQIAALYAQRWEAETGYQELKTFLRGPGRILRSRDPDAITQEIWALLCATQLIHTTRAAAAHTGGHDPDRISYTITLRALRRQITTGHAPRTTTREILSQLLPRHRRHRSYPRATKTSTSKRRQTRASLTGHITYTTTITPPPNPP
jgi:hypothetical protein